jgi:Ni/Co efflux regulator RcnB
MPPADNTAAMKPTNLKIKSTLALALAGILAIGPAMADKPSRAGNGNSDRNEHADQHERRDAGEKSSHDDGRREHFQDNHRVTVRSYYDEQYRGGHCPPGLAKKRDGCMPPGQARKWQIGRQLPREVVYYAVPQQLVLQIGPPPSGYRYVRVASDILMIAIGTGLVVDAIQDLGRS